MDGVRALSNPMPCAEQGISEQPGPEEDVPAHARGWNEKNVKVPSKPFQDFVI